MANETVNIASLQRAAKTYEPGLQLLPYITLNETFSKLGINMIDVNGKNVIVSMERKGGITRPYAAGDPDDDINAGEIGKVKERELAVKKCVLALRDHIDNYDQIMVVTGQMTGDNQDKKHPLEKNILEMVVKTVAEDIIDAAFHAKRDESDLTPLGMFDGYGELIDTEIAAGDIAAGKGNYKSTGAIIEPVDANSIVAINQIIDFVRSAHPQLLKKANLLIDPTTLGFIMRSLENKTKTHQLIDFEMLVQHLRSMCFAPNLNVITDPSLGSGGRIIMTTPGNLDFGMRTRTDKDFVQVNKPYKDPNWVQFWCQFDAGARVRSIHPKNFMVNDQVNTAIELSGDYNS